MSHPIVRKMVSDLIKEVDYDIWKEIYPTGKDGLIEFKGRRIKDLEAIALEAAGEYALERASVLCPSCCDRPVIEHFRD